MLKGVKCLLYLGMVSARVGQGREAPVPGGRGASPVSPGTARTPRAQEHPLIIIYLRLFRTNASRTLVAVSPTGVDVGRRPTPHLPGELFWDLTVLWDLTTFNDFLINLLKPSNRPLNRIKPPANVIKAQKDLSKS